MNPMELIQMIASRANPQHTANNRTRRKNN